MGKIKIISILFLISILSCSGFFTDTEYHNVTIGSSKYVIKGILQESIGGAITLEIRKDQLFNNVVFKYHTSDLSPIYFASDSAYILIFSDESIKNNTKLPIKFMALNDTNHCKIVECIHKYLK